MSEKRFSASGIICTVLSVVFIGVGVGMIVMGGSSVDSMQSAYQQNEKTLKDLRAQIDALNAEQPDEEVMEQKLHSAASAGAKVAEYQTAYADMDVLTDEDRIKENAALIGKYMKDKSNQVQWYLASGSDVDYEWSFETTYSFKESEVPVLWTCYSTSAVPEDRKLLAYAKGTYYATDDMFGELSYVVTDVGTTYLSGNVTDSGSGNSSNVLSQIDDGAASNGDSGESDKQTKQPDSTVTVSPDPELEERNRR